MIRIILFFIAVLFAITGFTQEQSHFAELQKVSKINLLMPGYEYEVPVGKFTTIGAVGELNAWGTIRFNGDIDQLDLVPSVMIYSRWYYNLGRRIEKGKKTIFNSASYLSGGIVLANPILRIVEKNHRDTFESSLYAGIFAEWGFRRNLGSRFSFDVSIKVQPTFENFKEFKMFLFPAMRFGYVLNNKD